MKDVQSPTLYRKSASLKASFASLALIGTFAFAGAAQADQDTSLRSWVKQADESVDDVMRYPSFAVKRGYSGRSVFRVTVDRDGNVLESELVENTGDISLRSAASRVVQRAEFPALPASFDDDQLRFSLRLNYIIAGSPAKARALMRDAEVRSEEISSGTPVAGRISILSASAD